MTDAILPLGFRKATIFAINSNGRIEAQDDQLVYNGLELMGTKNYTLNIPEPRRIPHVGNDRVLAVDQLPSQEPVAGELRVSPIDYDVDALLQGVKKFTVEDFSMIGRSTDMQGNEPQVALLLYRQALDKATKTRRWHYHIIPSTRCIPIPASFSENAEDHRYTIAPSPVTKHVWGTAFSIATEGFLETAILDGFSLYKPKLVAFKANGTEDEYLFSVSYPFVDATYAVWVDGVLRTANITKLTTGFTFTSSIPADNADIIAFGGVAND